MCCPPARRLARVREGGSDAAVLLKYFLSCAEPRLDFAPPGSESRSRPRDIQLISNACSERKLTMAEATRASEGARDWRPY